MAILELILLGAVAGFTIYLGLPIALMDASSRARGILNSVAIGILLFLLVDIMSDAMTIAEKPLLAMLSGRAGLMEGLLPSVILLAGLSLGLLGLVWFETRFIKDDAKATGEQKARRLAMMIAIGIGLHNFSEGLAIGQSYSSGVINLAMTLVIGFGLHNMTEGFGISAPLSGYRPPLWYLALLGLIGGGPTFIGAIAGGFWVSDIASILFLSLAGGAVVYVVKELLYHGKTSGEGLINMGALASGFMLGFVTLVLVHLWVG